MSFLLSDSPHPLLYNPVPTFLPRFILRECWEIRSLRPVWSIGSTTPVSSKIYKRVLSRSSQKTTSTTYFGAYSFRYFLFIECSLVPYSTSLLGDKNRTLWPCYVYNNRLHPSITYLVQTYPLFSPQVKSCILLTVRQFIGPPYPSTMCLYLRYERSTINFGILSNSSSLPSLLLISGLGPREVIILYLFCSVTFSPVTPSPF